MIYDSLVSYNLDLFYTTPCWPNFYIHDSCPRKVLQANRLHSYTSFLKVVYEHHQSVVFYQYYVLKHLSEIELNH